MDDSIGKILEVLNQEGLRKYPKDVLDLALERETELTPHLVELLEGFPNQLHGIFVVHGPGKHVPLNLVTIQGPQAVQLLTVFDPFRNDGQPQASGQADSGLYDLMTLLKMLVPVDKGSIDFVVVYGSSGRLSVRGKPRN